MRPAPFTRAWILRALACAVAARAALAASIGPSSAATGGSVVGATVLSSTNMSTAGCPTKTANITAFGTLAVNTGNITSADCQVTFGSSNDTAALRVAQVCCGTTPALAMQPDTVDLTYGGGDGYATTTIPGGATDVTAMAMRSDGRMYVVGVYTTGAPQLSFIARFMPDGTLDTSFNTTGWRSLDIAPAQNEQFNGVVVMPDGGAVAVGEAKVSGAWDGSIMRVTSTGGLDTSFNGTGWATFDNGGLEDRLNAVALQPDGNIVAAGYTGTGLSTQSLLVRYLVATGLKDTAGFGSPNGFVTRDFGNNDHFASVIVEPSGRIIAGGRRQPATYDGSIAAFLGDGTLDTAGFNSPNGYLSLTIQSYEEVVDIVRQPDGKFVLAIDTSGATPNTAVVARVNGNGTLDTAGFNAPNGYYAWPITNGAITHDANAVGLLPDGRIMMAGRTNGPFGSIVGRLETNGTPDASFGTGGIAYATAYGATEAVETLGILGNSLYVAGGINQPIGIMKWGGQTFDDYANTGAGTDRDWSSVAPNNGFFGLCLRAFTGTGAAPVWTVDANNDCTNSDADPWRAVPGTMASGSSLVGRAMTSGQDGDVRLRFAARVRTNQPPGVYEAPLAFEVTAPG